MYTGDHAAPHFHAGSLDEWEVRIFFLQEPVTYEVKWATKHVPSRVIRELLENAAHHRAELLEQWDRSVADA